MRQYSGTRPTAKLCLIDNFNPQSTRRFEISRAERFVKGSGMPVRIPVIEMIEIGAMADAHSVKMSPHNWNSTTVAFLAMLHVCAVMRNCIYAELYYDYLELGGQFAVCDYKLENGFATVPQRPGLGVEMKEDVMISLAP